MRTIAVTVVVAVALVVMAILFQGVFYISFVALPIVFAVGAAVVVKKVPGEAALAAAAIAFGVTALYGVAMVARADGSTESCESFCPTQSTARAIFAVIFTIAAFVAAGVAAAIAAIISSISQATRRAQASR